MATLLFLVAIYVRVSTKDQGRRGYSVPEQLDACREMARRLAEEEQKRTGQPVELQIVEFVDTVSGELLERPELDRLREFVREHRPQAVVCLDPDRFSRLTYVAILVANEIEAAGTQLHFVQHDYQATPEGRLFFTLRVAIAEYEKAKILERSMRGKRGKIKAGGLPVGLNMFGYHYDKATQKVMPDPYEAPWVEQVFEWAADGLGVYTIAERLNEAGVKRKRGGAKWYRNMVSKMLRNRAYIGELIVNRWDATGLGVQAQLPRERRTRRMTRSLRPEEEWIIIQIPPLITRELWDRVQAVRRGNPRRLAQRPTNLLSGLMVCGYCGGPIRYKWHHNSHYIIQCQNRYPLQRDAAHPAPPCKELPMQKAAPIEELVWYQVEQAILNPAYVVEHLERQRRQAEPNPSLVDNLRRELALLENELQQKLQEQTRILVAVAGGNVDPAVADSILAPYKQQIDSLRSRIALLQGRIAATSRAETEYQQVMNRLSQLRAAFGTEVEEIDKTLAALDGEGKRNLMRQLIRRVVVYRDLRVDIEFLG